MTDLRDRLRDKRGNQVMKKRHYENIPRAYQLHYLVQFQTHKNHSAFSAQAASQAIAEAVREVCDFNGYSLLAQDSRPNRHEALLSLTPEQSPEQAVTRLKTNTSRLFHEQTKTKGALWGAGKALLSIGKADLQTTLEYIERQYEKDYPHNLHLVTPETFTHPNLESLARIRLEGHWRFRVLYHIVFSSDYHEAVISDSQRRLVRQHLVQAGDALGFPVLKAESLYNHLHFVARAGYSDIPGTLAEAFLNELTERMSGDRQNFPVFRLFRNGLYVGTVGKETTALIKSWLQREVGKL